MRAFVAMRESLTNYKQLKLKLDEIEEKYDEQFKIVFQAINAMLEIDQKEEKKKLGMEIVTRGGTRTHTLVDEQRILSPQCLPFHHPGKRSYDIKYSLIHQ